MLHVGQFAFDSLQGQGHPVVVRVDRLEQDEPQDRGVQRVAAIGHGVGLPLALNIVRLHKGNIGIISKQDEGTEIRVMLPVYSEEKG